MDSAFSALGKKQLIDNFTNRPFESIEVMFIQLSRFWFHMPYYIRPIPGKGTIVAAVYKLILTVFMIIGFYWFALKKKENFSQITFFFLIIYSALHMLVFSSLRYSAPLVPFMILFAAVGIYYSNVLKGLGFFKTND